MKAFWLPYAILTLIAWGTMPEIRRLIDFKAGLFQPIELTSVVPLAMLLPFGWYLVRGGWKRAAPATRTFATLWLLAYGYAFVIGMLTGAPPVAVVYEFANYCAAVTIGIWFANELATNERAYRTIAWTLLAIGSFASIYAVAQYIAPFPWDAMWIYASGFKAAGLPYPFSMRAWGTMSSPGPFADYLVCTILLALPLARLRAPLATFALLLCCLGLAVTFVRANTIVLAIALVVYLLVSPRRIPTALGIGTIALLVALAFGIAPAFGETGSRLAERLADRFDTFGTLDTDVSVVERQNEISRGIDEGVANPLGLGLGVVGGVAKLDGEKGEAVTIDSGYVSRFGALGYLGMLGYLAVTLGALARTLRLGWSCDLAGDRERGAVVAAAAAMQAALVAIDFAVDGHAAFDGVLFWLSIALAFGYRPIAASAAAAVQT